MGDNGADRDLLLKELDVFFKNAKENNINTAIFSYRRKNNNQIKVFRIGDPATQLLLNKILETDLMKSFTIKKEIE